MFVLWATQIQCKLVNVMIYRFLCIIINYEMTSHIHLTKVHYNIEQASTVIQIEN